MELLMIAFFYVVIPVLSFVISIAILRWALRINDIVERLEHIAMSNHKIVQKLEMIGASPERKSEVLNQ